VTGVAPALVLSGAVGAMAFGALMVFLARRRDLVAFWLGLFLLAVSVNLLLARGSAVGQWSGYLALPFLACFVAALQPGPWPRRAALAVAFVGATAAVAGALAVMQGLALGVAAWSVAVVVGLVRERRTAWPVLIVAMALTYPAMVLQLLPAEELMPAGFIAFVVTPAVVLTRRAIRAFDAEERRSIDQIKFTADVFDSVPVALSMRDPNGRYLFVNKTWEKYYGLSREKAIGTSPRDRATTVEAEMLLAMDKAAMEAGPGVQLPPMDFVLGERRFLQTRTAMANSQGRLLGVLTASIDTTDRIAMERALAAEQRRLALVIRAGNVGILDWDGVTRTVYYSGRFKEILRHAPDADTSAWPDYFDLVHPEDKERVNQRFREHIFGKGPEGTQELHEPIQYRLRRADGTHVWIEAVGASVRDDKGYATRFIASIADISERRYQDEALRAAVRLREEVERMSRHDLKTPLNSMIAMARLLRAEGNLGSKDGELLGGIERAGYRILNMVNLSLDLFRMEQGKYEFRARLVDLAAVANRVTDDLQSQAASKRVAVRVHAGDATTAYGEELLCYSMLANLIKNAIEAAPDDSTVDATIEARGDALLVHVHNAGAVPEAIRARFFQKYATSGKSAGLGLGTYSARLMARVQQGDITLRTSDGEGTTVSVQLALARQAAAREEIFQHREETAVETGNLPDQRVLIVDDDEFNRMVLRHCLPNPPFQVELAVNGRAALEAAGRDWPDAVFLDLEMPVMDGYEAAAKLREMERKGERKRCIIVAISSNDDTGIIRRAMEAGCDHYLIKPAARDALLRILAGESPEPPSGAVLPESAAGDPVELDPDLEASLPAFFASRRKALDEMPAALGADDRPRFKRLAHKLNGSFTLYGFRWAAAQCRALERDAVAGDPSDLARRIAAVRSHLDTVKVSLRVD